MLIALFRKEEHLLLGIQSFWDALRLAERYGAPSPGRLRLDAAHMVAFTRDDDRAWIEQERVLDRVDGLRVSRPQAARIANALELGYADLPAHDALPAAGATARRPTLLETFSGDGRLLIHDLKGFLQRGGFEILSQYPFGP